MPFLVNYDNVQDVYDSLRLSVMPIDQSILYAYKCISDDWVLVIIEHDGMLKKIETTNGYGEWDVLPLEIDRVLSNPDLELLEFLPDEVEAKSKLIEAIEDFLDRMLVRLTNSPSDAIHLMPPPGSIHYWNVL